MELSKRLEACVQYTAGFLHLADIGTDHAFLPIEAVLRGHVMDAIAIDNKFGPYLQALQNVKKYMLKDRISVRFGDGLEKISDETDVVVISGMGGELIAKILQDGDHRNVKRFVCQPNRDADAVRKAGMELGYHIVDELVLLDNSKFYDVVVLEPGQASYSHDELEYGPINLIQRPYHFLKRLEHQIVQYRTLQKDISSEERLAEIRKTIHKLEEILNER